MGGFCNLLLASSSAQQFPGGKDGGGVVRLDIECVTRFFVSKKLLEFQLVGSDEIIFQDKPPVKREFNLGSLSGCSFPSGFLEHRISFIQFGVE